MSKINIRNWEPFRLDALFDIVKGSRLTKKDMKEGNIRYIGATAFNNGITNYIGNNEETHPGGTLTVCYNGSIGQTYYQDKEFWATDDVNVLYPKFQMSKYAALFIAPLIRAVGKNYAYIDKWKIEDMKNSIIYLPTGNNNQPDWEYIEQYMKSIEKQAQMALDMLTNVIGGGKRKPIKRIAWKEYTIGDFFIARNTGNILNRDIVDGSGSTPFVTASGANNGVTAYIDATKYELIKGNCILVGGKTFTLTYQKNDFVSNDSHNIVLYTKGNSNEQILLFIITVLRCSLKAKYYWGDAVTKEKLLTQSIILPTDQNGEPNWVYMQDYISNLQHTISSSPLL